MGIISFDALFQVQRHSKATVGDARLQFVSFNPVTGLRHHKLLPASLPFLCQAVDLHTRLTTEACCYCCLVTVAASAATEK